ncbi:MAG: amylo-alpha-1,6-glucosidase [Phycisphaerales bacterium]
MPTRLNESMEWLEADGLGGFAMGTATGVRTRRYHSLLTTSLHPPTDRFAMVKGLDAWVETPDGTWAISSQRYADGRVAPDGVDRLVSFKTTPWPTWEYLLPNGLRVVHELLVKHGSPLVCLSWRLVGDTPHARLIVRPQLACAHMHALHHANPGFDFKVHVETPTCLWWRPYEGQPAVFAAATNGGYVQDPSWYRGLHYAEEAARGFDHTEDLGSPGVFRWELTEAEGVLLLSAGETPETSPRSTGSPLERLAAVREAELARRSAFPSRLHTAADKYIVRRGEGRTVIAGYPWFGDWGRDTFIALRGLCLATGRLDDARTILTRWAGTVSEGMIPNRFTDSGDTPEFNAVDASLWFVVAAGEYLDACDGWGARGRVDPHHALKDAISSIVEGYARGTRYAIRACADGLLAAGEPGVQLSWMDARVQGREVTPRTGKPVEVQALWVNALHYATKLDARWASVKSQAIESFRRRFWDAPNRRLFDVVDADHRAGSNDATLRPNQILAVGGLPIPLIEGDQARDVVECVERTLLTPYGLRTLAPGEGGYRPRYEGGPDQRDGAYHQGAVWPWLVGSFVEAWLRVHGKTPENAATARRRFLDPLLRHLDEGGIDGVSELFDADAPRLPRGCPFQAWSLAELLRIGAILDRIERAGTPADPLVKTGLVPARRR